MFLILDHPYNYEPYVLTGFNIWLKIKNLFSILRFDFFPNSQYSFFPLEPQFYNFYFYFLVPSQFYIKGSPRYLAEFEHGTSILYNYTEVHKMFLFVKSTRTEFDVFSFIRDFLVHSSTEFNACWNRDFDLFPIGATDRFAVSSANVAIVVLGNSVPWGTPAVFFL